MSFLKINNVLNNEIGFSAIDLYAVPDRIIHKIITNLKY